MATSERTGGLSNPATVPIENGTNVNNATAQQYLPKSLEPSVLKAPKMQEGDPCSPQLDEKLPAAEDADDAGSDWTDESMIEDTLEELEDGDYGKRSSAECCTLEESRYLRKQLREIGPEEFVRITLESDAYSVRKLCTAFGVLPSTALEDAGEEVFYTLLGALMKRELSKRHRIPEYTSVDDAAKLLNERSNIIVLTGAGISTNLGIPDFRSKGTGLYSRLEHLGLSDPQEVFDISLFREDPTIFYSIAKDIAPEQSRYSPTHAFIRLLQEKGKLLTNFTQNIDNLESAAGIVPEKLIQCHGSFATATCQQCRFNCPGDQISDDLKAGRVPKCPVCVRSLRQMAPLTLKRKHSSNSTASKKKRKHDFEDSSDSDDADNNIAMAGVMKPDITFFGEDLPRTFHDRIIEHDKDRVDLVIVIGTSLKVAPVADIPDFLPQTVPQIYISRDPVNHIEFDIELLGDCDQIVTELCRRAGWDLQHEMVPEGQVLDVQLHSEASATRWKLTPHDGSVTTTRKELDSGTLGHGSALLPTLRKTRAAIDTSAGPSKSSKSSRESTPKPKGPGNSTAELPLPPGPPRPANFAHDERRLTPPSQTTAVDPTSSDYSDSITLAHPPPESD